MDDTQRQPSAPPADDDATRLLPTDDLTLPAGPRALGPNAHALAPGTRLHEFEITEVLGEGGFGIVYLARDLSLSRVVAVKEYMPSSLADRTGGLTVSVRSDRHADTFLAGLRSFVNEAKMLAHFDHPSLLKVHRFWEANGTAYMAMPYYRGQTLKARMQQAGPPPTEAWLRQLLVPLLDALKLLHSENCFHRDIAPDNILLLADDRPVLLDFGAARQVIGDMTQGLTVILKSGYAPIEQYAEINTLRQGPWTDLYALGATLHSVLTGKPPAPAVQRMLGDQVVPLTQRLAGQYSAPFLAAIDAVLRVSPADRPQDVAAFEALLDRPAEPALPVQALSTVPSEEATRLLPAEPTVEAARTEPTDWAERTMQAGPPLETAQATATVRLSNPPPPPPSTPPPSPPPEPVLASPPDGDVTVLMPPPSPAVAAAAPKRRIRPWWLGLGAVGAFAAIGLAVVPGLLRQDPSSPVATPDQTRATPAPVSTPLATEPNAALPAVRPTPEVPPPAASQPTAGLAPKPVPLARSAAGPSSGAEAAKPPAAKPPKVQPASPPARAEGPAPLRPTPKAAATADPEPSGKESAQSSHVKGLLTQARQKLNEHQYAQAAALAQRALALEPGHPRATELLQRAREGERRAFDDIKME